MKNAHEKHEMINDRGGGNENDLANDGQFKLQTCESSFHKGRGVGVGLPPSTSCMGRLVLVTMRYVRVESFLPASMLSQTHSGRTTWTFSRVLPCRSLWVFDPLSCCDVRMCVAPEMECLDLKSD
jgi:hypothetical protein